MVNLRDRDEPSRGMSRAVALASRRAQRGHRQVPLERGEVPTPMPQFARRAVPMGSSTTLVTAYQTEHEP